MARKKLFTVSTVEGPIDVLGTPIGAFFAHTPKIRYDETGVAPDAPGVNLTHVPTGAIVLADVKLTKARKAAKALEALDVPWASDDQRVIVEAMVAAVRELGYEGVKSYLVSKLAEVAPPKRQRQHPLALERLLKGAWKGATVTETVIPLAELEGDCSDHGCEIEHREVYYYNRYGYRRIARRHVVPTAVYRLELRTSSGGLAVCHVRKSLTTGVEEAV